MGRYLRRRNRGLTSAWRATADPSRVRMIHRNSNLCPASSARSRSAVPHARRSAKKIPVARVVRVTILYSMQAKLEEIQNAVTGLPKGDYDRFRDWFIDRDWELWDHQIEADSEAGKLDRLVEEALAEKKSGKLKGL